MLARRVILTAVKSASTNSYSTMENQLDLHNREHIFSFSRSRDHYSALDLVQSDYAYKNDSPKNEAEFGHSLQCEIESFDCRGTVNLSSTMQTNVPFPYQTSGKAPVDLNMPGGSILKLDKHLSSHRVSLINDYNYCQE
jgi:hypothetical protein